VAVATQEGGLGRGFNLSIYYMLGTMALVLGGFAFLILRSFRRARLEGGYRPEGKLRWSDPS
jgi:hypothetical protein